MLSDLIQALEDTKIPFKHYAWSHAPDGTYGVYAEDGSNILKTDDGTGEYALEGTVDLFTRDDSDTPRETVEAALESCGCAWYLNSVQFEDDTGYIHFEWVFQVA